MPWRPFENSIKKTFLKLWRGHAECCSKILLIVICIKISMFDKRAEAIEILGQELFTAGKSNAVKLDKAQILELLISQAQAVLDMIVKNEERNVPPRQPSRQRRKTSA